MDNAVSKAELMEAITLLEDKLAQMMRRVETRSNAELHRYAMGQQPRMHSLEIADSDVRLRLASIEERLFNIEMRRPPSV